MSQHAHEYTGPLDGTTYTYIEACLNAAKRRNQHLYVWRNEAKVLQSSTHHAFIPSGQPYWTVCPSGAVINTGGME